MKLKNPKKANYSCWTVILDQERLEPDIARPTSSERHCGSQE